MTRYLESIKPLSTDEGLNNSIKAINEFSAPGGLGEVLQNRLYELDKRESNNWLESLWLNKAYLEWREPSFININWFAKFSDNPALGVDTNAKSGSFTMIQIERAAGLISNILNTNDKINSQQLAPDMQKGTPLCMNQFKYQFGTTRIPQEGCDTIVSQYPCKSRHIVAMYHDQIFSVPVYDVHGDRVSIKSIVQQLLNVVNEVRTSRNLELPVGILTTENRDTWAKARSKLEKDPLNRATLEAIDSALFVVCLDSIGVDSQLLSNVDETCNHFLRSNDGRNRWYDKAFQIIVLNNGQAGCNGEHSPVDALTTGRICVDAAIGEPAQDPAGISSNKSPEIGQPKHLRWSIGADVYRTIEDAKVNATKLAKNVNVLLADMEDFGSEWIKQAKVSPDIFVQMAMQLAYYRKYNEPCATYETASTRAFLHGRTETIRSCSMQSLRFSKAFDDNTVSINDKIQLFKGAVAAHANYMKAAGMGRGVDRHLMGLRYQINSEKELEEAKIFTDPAFARSCTFKLSTSNVSSGDYFRGGFAPVTEHGYGINYNIGKDKVTFSISEWINSSETDSTHMKQAIIKSMQDIRSSIEYFAKYN
ncbi:Carnitine O-acetyltransferase mitochondrial [Mycoemilia scoparia]|uniref:Carnitine O-acetyltransferase mitochondrial n=1 Tax=Mycoemilia scoparia TaxID=417184 RepID=A0A9W8A063_9FUNG|nr:Carnitine O-acetyltransferase mitochondrial [Mycoemilia scoparia]